MSAFRSLSSRLTRLATLASLGVAPALIAGCGGHGSGPATGTTTRVTGQTDFVSAPLPGTSSGLSFGAGGSDNAGTAAPVASAPSSQSTTTTTTRTVQETDLYAVEGNRLYYLNSYRGLMIFDITNADAPALIGRAPIFGDPQEMTVSNNIAVVVVGDWYGNDNTGAPFHGSIVRGFDTTDPTNIKVVGDAKLGGYVQDTRIVGNVLYAVIQDYGWEYGWYANGFYGGGGVDVPVAGGVAEGGGGGTSSKVAIASVSFANGIVSEVGYQEFNGSGGVFNVTANSIMLAFQHQTSTSDPDDGDATQTDLQYVDISDPGGAIALRGKITVNGVVSGWGPDNGRWNLDFADGQNAHALGCATEYCGDQTDAYLLQTVSFANPDAPTLTSTMPISNLGWSAAARFSGTRLYLSPSDDYYGSNNQTPFSVYDLSVPATPTLLGTTQLAGSVWLYIPDGTRLFSIGNTDAADSSQVDVQYLDVTNAASPQVIGQSVFGDGWSWTPAADTFKAFTLQDSQGLAVVPFSGWDYNGQTYTNGVQLIQYTSTSMIGSATANTKGWVERGIFVGPRLYSLSDEALAVIDYTNPAAPKVTDELTLARNVVNAQPQGTTIAELSSDWWGNDVSTSEMRVMPIASASETADNGQGQTATIDGVGATIFQNGTLSYVVTDVQHTIPCGGQWSNTNPNGTCYDYAQQVQVVDTTNGGAVLRGKVLLPDQPMGWDGWGWDGFWYYDWFDGADIVQVGNDALAFHRWYPQYGYGTNGYTYIDSIDALVVVDLSNPDKPGVASTSVTTDPTAWWGNLQAIGNTLYATHYDWITRPDPNSASGSFSYVRYYLDQIDLTDRAHPAIGQRINVPGVLVGGSSTDPTIIYTIDYRWDSLGNSWNDIDVLKLDGGLAYLQSQTTLDGWVGNVIVQNDTAYTTAQEYTWMMTTNGVEQSGPAYMELHQINLTNPSKPVDSVTTKRSDGWGWLLGVQGDRAIVTSGWGDVGFDIYKLSPNAAPVFDQFALTLGWGANSIARQNNSLYVSSGYWGVEQIDLTQ